MGDANRIGEHLSRDGIPEDIISLVTGTILSVEFAAANKSVIAAKNGVWLLDASESPSRLRDIGVDDPAVRAAVGRSLSNLRHQIAEDMAEQSKEVEYSPPHRPISGTTGAGDPGTRPIMQRVDLVQVATGHIDQDMIVGTASNVPAQVPAAFHGLFFIESALGAGVFSLANTVWDERAGALLAAACGERTRSWNDSLEGRLLHEAARTVGLHFRMKFDGTSCSLQPVFRAADPERESHVHLISRSFAPTFSWVSTGTPDVWDQMTSHGKKGPSRLIKIVDGSGKRTPNFDSYFLPRINSQRDFSSLTPTQLIAKPETSPRFRGSFNPFNWFTTNVDIPAEISVHDTRNIGLCEVPSEEIERFLIPGNSSNMPPQVPEVYYGIFYIEGNPLPLETVSFANGVWNVSSGRYFVTSYEPHVWGFDDSNEGRQLYEVRRELQICLEAEFAKDGTATFKPIIKSPCRDKFVESTHDRTPFTCEPTSDSTVLLWKTKLLPGTTLGASEYRLVKIVNGDGTKTKNYEKVYLPRINAGKTHFEASKGLMNSSHLGKSQLVPRVESRDTKPSPAFVNGSFRGYGTNPGVYVAPSEADSRSPCPALNSLANHGYLPRDGRKITEAMIVAAMENILGVDSSAVKFLTKAVFGIKGNKSGVRDLSQVLSDGTPFMDLSDLSYQTERTLQHDVSLTRQDKYFGDNSVAQPDLVDRMIAASSDGKVLTADDLARYRVTRYQDSLNKNPEILFGLKQLEAAMVESAVALNVLGRDQKIPVEYIKPFFLEGRIPQSYCKPPKPVTFTSLLGLAALNAANWERQLWHFQPRPLEANVLQQLNVKIAGKKTSKQFPNFRFELVVYHSDSVGKNSEINETKPMALTAVPDPGNDSSHRQFHVVSHERIGKEILAIAVIPRKFLFETSKSCWVDYITVECNGSAQYFPVYSCFTDSVKRVFFHGTMLSNDPCISRTLSVLRKQDMDFWQSYYVPAWKEEGLPYGMTDNPFKLNPDEDSSGYRYADIQLAEKTHFAENLTPGTTKFHSFEAVELDLKITKLVVDEQVFFKWRDDAFFGAQMISGTHPVVIHVLPKTFAFPADLCPKLTLDGLKSTPYLQNKNVLSEIKRGSFSFVDFRELLSPFVGLVNSKIGLNESKKFYNGYLAAPIGFFWHDAEKGELYPVAIQVVEEGDVFYAVDATKASRSENNRWTLAKMWFGLADTICHELITHLLKAHLCIEPFGIALNRQISPCHPVRKFLKPYFVGTMNVNGQGRDIFIPVISKVLSMGDSIFPFFRYAYKSWKFLETDPVSDLKARGFLSNESSLDMPGQYPWAEDAIDLYQLILSHVKEFISTFYSSDADVTGDIELQEWIKECNSFHNSSPGRVPEKISSINDLITICATIIWTASGQHSSTNYPQREYYSYVPNRCAKAHVYPLMSNEEEVSDSMLLDFLPHVNEALLSVIIARVLSQYKDTDTFIGQVDEDWFGPSAGKVQELFVRFQEAIKAYDVRIDARNAELVGRKGKKPYEWLRSDKVVKSLYPHVMDAASSPCPVCLEPLADDRVVLRACLHVFCMPCIARWAAQSHRCPICKASLRDGAISRLGIVPLVSSRSLSFRHSAHRQRLGASAFRAEVYARSLLAIRDPLRKPSPTASTAQALYVIRAPKTKEWIVRDLRAILGIENVEIIALYTLAVLEQNYPLPNRRAIELLQDYIGAKTEHFVHELVIFMESGVTVAAYDEVVRYPEWPACESEEETELQGGNNTEHVV
ncbi:hypothetical protein HDU84_000989 [Entophlyctis sp. JEL0112]|nr:hypothetical protein HDU84_000989 [Entophlyctis sp. JEL0112]